MMNGKKYLPTISRKLVAKFIVSDWGDKVGSGIGFSYRPARLHRLAGRYDNLGRSQQYLPFRDFEFGYWYSRANVL